MDKENMMYICDEIPGSPVIYNNINDPRRLMLLKISQTQKDRHCIISLIWGNLKKNVIPDISH